MRKQGDTRNGNHNLNGQNKRQEFLEHKSKDTEKNEKQNKKRG